MAERRRPRKEFVEDRIVQNLVPDPGQPPPDAVVLRGYMGRSDRDGHRRLYLDDSLSSWVEVPEDAILHVETTPEDESGTAIWVRRGAQLETRQVRSARAGADFLAGDIAQRYGSGAAPVFDPGVVLPTGFVASEDFICNRTVGFGCERTPDVPCPREQTPDFPCPATFDPGCGR